MRRKLPCDPSRPAIVFAGGLGLLFVFGFATQTLVAQENAEQPPPRPNSGLTIRNVSAYTVYYSTALPTGYGYQPGVAQLQSDLAGGGSAEISWSRFSEQSSFSLDYTPSFIGRVRYTSWNALNHALYLNASRKIAPRWTFNSFVKGELDTEEAFLFAPGGFSGVVSAPASFDDLAGALLASKFNNPQLASALASVPAQSPVRNLLYGARVFSAAAHASFTYRYSPRLSFTFSGDGGRTQNVSAERSPASIYFVPDTTSGSADARFSYALSPLTQLSGSATTTRVASRLYETQTTTTTAQLGRTVARRWLLQVRGGIGISNYLHQPVNSQLTVRPHPEFGGSLGLKTFSHTLIGSFDRTGADAYAIGASRSLISSANWRWKRPDRVWWLESGVSWERVDFEHQAGTSGWRASAGWGRSLSTHIALLAQYAYLRYSGRYQTVANDLSQSAVRLSLTWTPHPDFAR